MFCIENLLLQIFALEGFVKACPVSLTDSYIRLACRQLCVSLGGGMTFSVGTKLETFGVETKLETFCVQTE